MTDKHKKAIQIIGAEIQTYNHFAEYSVPFTENIDDDGISLLDCVYNYFYTKMHNSDYYSDTTEDLKDERQCKSFIKKRINDESYDIGMQWLKDHNYKLDI